MTMENLTQFEQYFHTRADIAESLCQVLKSQIDAKIIITTAIDALSKIWLQDFPNAAIQLRESYGQEISEARRFSEFLKIFAGRDSSSSKIAVICFAEDWKENAKSLEDQDFANLLLRKRINEDDPYQFPKSHLDLSISELEVECPLILENSNLNKIAREYEYGAFIYRFYRCPLVHSFKYSDRIHGFARDFEISYYQATNSKTAIDFGLQRLTHWLRLASTEYVQYCKQMGKIPAETLKSDEQPERAMSRLWNRYTR
ncbi:hypothetical protein VPK24_10370 [Limnothrix redekei LRLZ20PSL1]|uniref:Uncharacterized protein n=2 Tax=Limnothrix TaxID=132605 RepID=A0ABW7CA50_9CYAN